MTGQPQRTQPIVDELTRPFWDATASERLLLQHCPACDRSQWPPRPRCQACGGEVGWRAASGRARLYTHSVVRRSSHPVPEVPYVLAVVELEEGVHFTTNVVGGDPEALEIGMALEVAFEPLEDGLRLPVFAPAS